MDGVNWKHTLLAWINCTNFIEKPLEDLGYFDINEFFAKLKEKMAHKVVVQGNLMAFLKEYYPQFEPHMDETNNITVPDYMYIYSLFLHFCCVRYPDVFFHETCISMKTKCQMSIKKFLEILAKDEKFDRVSLRSAIHESVPLSPRLSFLPLNFHTPVRTPKNFKNSPPTPTAILLDDKTREIKTLKAQLDSEKYDRGFLEVQLKQYEERLNRLLQEQQQNHLEINELRQNLLYHETENFSPNRNLKEEEAKKRLRKEISDKNEQILDLKAELMSLKDEHKSISEKLAYTEKEMRQSKRRVDELQEDFTVNEEELHQKNEMIRVLQLQVEDLETHISRNRASIPKEILDSSGDMLDFSINTDTNYFSEESESCPENMAVVIDIKLKEAERENHELKELYKKYNEEFTAQIRSLLEKCDETSNIADAFTLEEHLETLMNTYEALSNDHSVAKSTLADLKQQLESKSRATEQLTSDKNSLKSMLFAAQRDLEVRNEQVNESGQIICALEAELKELTTKCDQIMAEKHEHIRQNQDLNERFTIKSQEVDTKEQEIKQLTEKLRSLLDESKILTEKLNDESTKFVEFKKSSTEKYQELLTKYENESKQRTDCLEENTKLRHSQEELAQKLSEKSDKITELEQTICEVQGQLKTSGIENQEIKEKLEKASDECKSTEKRFKEQVELVEKLSADYHKLLEEKSECEANNQDLSTQHAALLNDMTSKNEKIREMKEAISELLKQISSLENEKTKLCKTIEEHSASLELYQTKFNEQQSEMDLLKENVSQLSEDLIKKEEQMHSLKTETEELKAQLKTEQEQTIVKDQCIQEKESKVKEMSSNLDSCSLKSEELEDRIKTLNAQLEALTMESDSYKENSLKKDVEIKSLTEKIDLMTEEKSKTEAQLKYLEEKALVDVSEQEQEFQARESTLKSEIEEISVKYQQISQEHVESQSKNRELHEKNTELSEHLESRDHKINELLSSVDQVKTKLAETTKKLENVSEKLKFSQAQTEGKLTEIKILQTKIDEMQAEYLKAEGERNLLTTQIKRLECQLKDKEETERVNDQCLEEKESHIQELDAKLKHSMVSNQKSYEQNQELQQQLQTSLKQIGIILPELESYKEKCALKEMEVSNLNKDLKSAHLEKSLIEKDVARLEKEKISIETEASKVKHELQAHQTNLTTEISTLTLIADKLKEENHSLQQNLLDCERKKREIETSLENISIKHQTQHTELKVKYENLQLESMKAKERLEDMENSLNNVSQQNHSLKALNETLKLEADAAVKCKEELQIKLDAIKEASSSKADIERLEKQFKESDLEKAKHTEKIIEIINESKAYKDDADKFREELEVEKSRTRNMKYDIEILTAKLQKSRSGAAEKEKEHDAEILRLNALIKDEGRSIEQRIETVRSEMEGKLEKMKEKMFIQCDVISSTTDERSIVLSTAATTTTPPFEQNRAVPLPVIHQIANVFYPRRKSKFKFLLNLISSCTKYILPTIILNYLLYILFQYFLDENDLEVELRDKLGNYY